MDVATNQEANPALQMLIIYIYVTSDGVVTFYKQLVIYYYYLHITYNQK